MTNPISNDGIMTRQAALERRPENRGERAGEVVETLREFPKLTDPRTGKSLMERTIIICNTSSMPVAAREASIYTGITLGEYYRQMGYHVLLLADSTSRWAQAMRETSGRMEEIPGDEAFPAYLDSSVKNIYERAGVIKCPDQSIGSLTMIGTVSPAGGNFEEPVTQATLSTVKTFLGLSSERAYRRYYPAAEVTGHMLGFTDIDDRPGAPTLDVITDDDACYQDGITITFTGGAGALQNDLWMDGALAQAAPDTIPAASQCTTRWLTEKRGTSFPDRPC